MSQLYQVKTRGLINNGSSIEHTSYITCANSMEEVNLRINHFIDVSVYTEFSVMSISRIKPNFHILNKKTTDIAQHNENKKGRNDVKHGVITEEQRIVSTLQNKNKNLYAFGLIGNIIAKSKDEAMVKVANFLLSQSSGSCEKLPFVSCGHFILDELGEASSATTTNLDKMSASLFKGKISTVSGGNCSPK